MPDKPPRTKRPSRPSPKPPPRPAAPLPAPRPNGQAHAPLSPPCPWLTADRVTRSPIDWLVPWLVPRGRCTAVVGESGAGKSTLYAALIAAHTTGSAGGRFGLGAANCAPGRALLYSPEGVDSEETIGRLRAAGADMARVILGDLGPDGRRLPSPRLPDDLPSLLPRWLEARVSMVILDPILSYLAPGVSPFDSVGVRALLELLEECAGTSGITLLYTCHLRKSRLGSPLDWIAGSGAWHQVPRHIVAMGRDPQDFGRRVILSAKSPITAAGQASVYSIEPREGHVVFRLGEGCGVTAEDLGRAVAEDYERDALAEAKAYLRDALADEERRASDLVSRAKASGIGDRTLRRAKVQLGITHAHLGRAPDRHIVWRRPEVWPE